MLVGCIPRSSINQRSKPQTWNYVIFEAPSDCMKTHLKPMFIQIKIDGCILVNKVLVDDRAVVKLMPKVVMERLRKTDEDLILHNLLITHFNGKSSKSKGIIALNI